MKKKKLEYQDIEFLQWVLNNIQSVDNFSKTLNDKIYAMNLKLIAIKSQMEYTKEKQ